ncbi:MAG: hypothetical protein MK194_16810, partial [Roseibacillus sp.]|nr:hypothetical protein [Roseibacillus sp.]
MSTKLPREITKPLRALLGRVRRMQILRGLAAVATVLLGGLLLSMAAHLIFAPLPVVVSWFLLGSIVAGALWALWTWLLKPLRGRITLVQIARWLETRHPEIQERVSTALELSSDSRGGVSEGLLKELVLEAQGDVREVDPTVEVRARRAKRWLWPAAGLTAVFVLVFVIFPGEAQRLLVRAVAPFSDLGNAGAVRFTIEPENIEVLEGDEVKITIKYSDSEVELLSLIMKREGEETLTETLKRVGMEDGVSRFEYRLPAAKDSFHYFAQVGKALSDGYDVTVAPLPRIQEVEVAVDFPKYTDQSSQRRPLGRGISALGGSTITVEGRTTTGVERGRFLLDGKEVGTVSLDAGETGTRVSVNWMLEPEKGGLGQIMLYHELGREIEGLRFPVKVEQDVVPKVVLLAPTQAELRLRPDEQVRLEYEVSEDFGLDAAAVDLLVNGSTVDPLPAAVPEQDTLSAKPIWRGEELVSIGALTEKYKNADELRMAVAVTDNLPESLGGPNVGRSEWLIIKIDRNAESLARQEIRAQQSDVRETIAEAIKEVREAKDRMEWHKEDVKKEELSEQAEKHLAEAREKLANANEQLEELADRMENGVQAARAEDVREAAQEVTESRESLEETPLQDTPEGRAEELNEAREAAEEAIEQLQAIQQAVQQDEGRLENLAQLNELAQRENEIARQAANNEQQQGAEAEANPEIQQAQEQVQAALEQQINQNPEARAEVLENQADAAADLAEQAAELSERQENLADAAEAQLAAQEDQPQEGQPQEGQPQEGQPQQGQPQQGQPQQPQPQEGQPQQRQPQEAQPQEAQPHQK